MNEIAILIILIIFLREAVLIANCLYGVVESRHLLLSRIKRLEKIIYNAEIYKAPEGHKFIPTDKPFITEDGKDKRLEEFEEEISNIKDILDKTETHLRNMKIRVTNIEKELGEKNGAKSINRQN